MLKIALEIQLCKQLLYEEVPNPFAHNCLQELITFDTFNNLAKEDLILFLLIDFLILFNNKVINEFTVDNLVECVEDFRKFLPNLQLKTKTLEIR